MPQDNWATPPEVTEPLFRFWKGPVGLDPCSNDVSIVQAKRRYTAGGLVLPWDAPSIYKNEPYSRLLIWAKKTIAESKILYRSKRKEIVGLEPVATSTEWWKITVEADPLLVFTKRIAFLDEKGMPVNGARFDSVFTVFGCTGRREDELVDLLGPLVRFVMRGRDWRIPSVRRRAA